jgi:hypothetical protein
MALSLLIAIHNHQPEGNFGYIFESAHRDCYQPIVDALLDFPTVKVALHHTGPLLEWQERNRPEYFENVRALVERGQVELLGGGFYEPMLSVLPERDATGQILMMADYLEHHFGRRPQGMWLAERVWEPQLPKLIAEAGMRFTLVDDGHFRAAGIEGPLRGHYVTEKGGTPLAIFPIDKRLRDSIPFSEISRTMEVFREIETECGGTVTYGDDGEKFGVWPKTKEWVWERGWLRQFFEKLTTERHLVETHAFGDQIASASPTGRVYLPTAAYEEMGEWSLPAPAQLHYLEVRRDLEARGQLERARPFFRGGIWQGFFAKYREADQLHKRMIAVSRRVAEAASRGGADRGRIELMTRELYRAQCNCCYWHGLFGGLYLNYLRDAAYHHMLVAEAFADADLGRAAPDWAGGQSRLLSIEESDVDADLRKEIVLSSPELALTIRPHEGGVIEELAYRPKSFMLSNVLGRHREGYHEKLRSLLSVLLSAKESERGESLRSIHDLVEVKESGLDRLLVYDQYPRHLFIDHFFSPTASLAAFAAGAERELGDFVGTPYRVLAIGGEEVVLARTGTVEDSTVEVQKRFLVPVAKEAGPGRLEVHYRLTLVEGAPCDVLFAPELSLTLLDGHSDERTYRLPDQTLASEARQLASRGTFENVSTLSLVNAVDGFCVELSFGSHRPSVWRFPLETVSNSESGFERTYQGSVLVPHFPLRLSPLQPIDLVIAFTLSDL